MFDLNINKTEVEKILEEPDNIEIEKPIEDAVNLSKTLKQIEKDDVIRQLLNLKNNKQ